MQRSVASQALMFNPSIPEEEERKKPQSQLHYRVCASVHQEIQKNISMVDTARGQVIQISESTIGMELFGEVGQEAREARQNPSVPISRRRQTQDRSNLRMKNHTVKM